MSLFPYFLPNFSFLILNFVTMTTKIFLAGVLGAVAMFTWQFIAHMFLPLGEAGFAEIPNESAVVAVMQSNIGEKVGLYLYPGTGLGPTATKEEKSEVMKRMPDMYASKPSGLLLYHPPGEPFKFGQRLAIQFVTDLVLSLLAVFLLARARLTTFGSIMGVATVIGLIAAIVTNIPLWNWYGFPCVYTTANVTMELVSFLCVGLVAALMLRPSPSAAP